VVSIFTYRDERKLLALIGTIIVIAAIALIQVNAAKGGRPSFFDITVGSLVGVGQRLVTGTLDGIAHAGGAIADVPRYYAENERLNAKNRELAAENARLRDALSEVPGAAALQRALATNPKGIPASTIGVDLEGQTRTITLDRGSTSGITVDAAVVDADGAVGRVVSVQPFVSRVLLLTDPTSKIPAIAQRGRWWGIATGTNAHIQLQYVSQDAPLRVGDLVVTGEGRTFHAGVAIGRVTTIYRPQGALYQAAVLEPAARFGRIGRVLVLPR
jgi:rod shape-determining protein MreC